MLSRRRSGYLRCCGIKLIMPSGIRHVAGQRGSQGPRMTPGERRGLQKTGEGNVHYAISASERSMKASPCPQV